MRSKSILVVVTMCVLLSNSLPSAHAIVRFDDNQTYYIDYPINDFVYVEGGQTIVYWLEGASAFGLEAYDYSQIIVDGGEITYDLESYDYGQITVISGLVGDDLGAYRSSQVSLKGGLITNIWATEDGVMTIYGTNFNYDYGELPKGYFDPDYPLNPLGHLSGILLNGDTIDVDYYIRDNASIMLVPEPSTLLLLGLGALMLRRKR